jgi:hypothetical protein
MPAHDAHEVSRFARSPGPRAELRGGGRTRPDWNCSGCSAASSGRSGLEGVSASISSGCGDRMENFV